MNSTLRKARKPAILAATALVAALILAACGGSGGDSGTPIAGMPPARTMSPFQIQMPSSMKITPLARAAERIA